MIPREPNNTNELEVKIDIAYQSFLSTLNTIQRKHWNAEGIYGKGLCLHYKMEHYLNAILYTVLIYLNIQSNKPTIAELKVNFDIDNMIKCFYCNDISLKNLFDIFGINLTFVNGINNIGIEQSFFIEQCAVNNAIPQNILVNYQNILDNPYYINPILIENL